MLLLVLCLPVVLGYHCAYDEELEGVRKVDVKIQPAKEKVRWVSNMEFFLFGELGDSPESAMISAGFYRANGDLVYKLLVNCAEQTWSTLYKLPKQRGQVWKTGALADPCKKGSFDIVYELQNEIRGKFLFNGSPAEGELKKQYKMMGVPRMKTWTGKYRIQKLPVNLRHGVVFKAYVSEGNTLQRSAYGKCFAFPSALTNCLEAKEWVLRRSKIHGPVHVQYTDHVFEGLGEYGAWSLAAGPTCNTTHHDNFARIQTSVMPDAASTNPITGLRRAYCCCASSDGVLEGRCEAYDRSDEGAVCTEENLCPEESNLTD